MTSDQQFIIELLKLFFTVVVTPVIAILAAKWAKSSKDISERTETTVNEVKEVTVEAKHQAEEYHKEVNGKLTGYTEARAEAEFHKGKEVERLEQMNRELLLQASPLPPVTSPPTAEPPQNEETSPEL